MTPPNLPSLSPFAAGQPLELDVQLRLDDVLATVGFLPSALIGSLAERQWQLVDHHRRSTIKRYGGPGGAHAKRLIASRLYGYGSKKDPATIGEVVGESFAAATSDGPFEARSLQRLEEGGSYTTSEAMIMPVGAGAREIRGGIIPTKQFADAMKKKAFIIINTGKAKGLVIARYAKRGKAGERSVILGKIRHGRTQRPLLNFFDRFDDVQGKHMAAMEKDVELAMTAAGQAKLQNRLDGRVKERAAYTAARDEMLKQNPKGYAEAKKAAKAAAAAVRAQNKVGESGGAV